jgi:membrane-associated phospholipid phosphatase
MKNIKKYQNSLIDDTLKQISSLGSHQFYIIVTILFIINKEYLTAIKLIFGLIFIYLLGYGIRVFYFKERPIPKNHSNLFERIKASSFPSGHALKASYLYFTLIAYFSFNYLIIFFFSLILALIMQSRIHFKKHHISDLIVGFIIGFIIYIFIELLNIISYV